MRVVAGEQRQRDERKGEQDDDWNRKTTHRSSMNSMWVARATHVEAGSNAQLNRCRGMEAGMNGRSSDVELRSDVRRKVQPQGRSKDDEDRRRGNERRRGWPHAAALFAAGMLRCHAAKRQRHQDHQNCDADRCDPVTHDEQRKSFASPAT
jgi:hypothetical protein